MTELISLPLSPSLLPSPHPPIPVPHRVLLQQEPLQHDRRQNPSGAPWERKREGFLGDSRPRGYGWDVGQGRVGVHQP